MINSLVKKFLILFSAIKAIFVGVFTLLGFYSKNSGIKFISNLIIIIFVSWIGGFFIYLNSIDSSWKEINENHPELEEKTDAIIVLTGGSERIRNAFHLIKKDYAKKLFISGVNKEVKLPELFVIHGLNKDDFFQMLGKVELGFSAENTIENAVEVKDWLAKYPDIKTIRLITSNYHIDRAVNEVASLSPEIKIIAHPVLPVNVRIDKWYKFSGTRNLLISEYNKLIASYFRIFIEKFKN